MSRYHVLPRDSIDSDRDAHEYLIPSPESGLISSSNPERRSCSFDIHPSVILRLFSSTLAFTSFMILLLTYPNSSYIAASSFLILIFTTNLVKLLHLTFTSCFRLALFYKGRDILAPRPATFRRPSFTNFLDLALIIGLIVSLSVGVSGLRWDWYSHAKDSDVAASVLGYMVIACQAIIAVPALDRIRFTVRGSVRPSEEPLAIRGATQQHDRKEPIMTGASGLEESTAIPPSEEVAPSTEVEGDLV